MSDNAEILELKLKPIGSTNSFTEGGQKATFVELVKEERSEVEYAHFGRSVKLGSRKVVIRVVPRFSMLPSEPAAKVLRDEVTLKIGASWKAGTRDILRGLTKDEEIAYLPTIIACSPTDNAWNQKTFEFWANFGTEVPNNEDGLELEVGFKLEKDKAVPINLADYITYNHCYQHIDVASTPDQLDNMFVHKFYMEDKGAKAEVAEKMFEVRKIANKAFAKLIEGQDGAFKVDWILETVGGKEGKGISIVNLSPSQKEMELEKLKDKNPSQFLEIVKDPHLETKALIRKAVGSGAIVQDGTSYFYGNKVIGSTLIQAVGYLENAANQTDRLLITEKVKSYSV